MGIFFGPSAKITPGEFERELRRALRKQGFSDVDLDEVTKVFQGDLKEGGGGYGISKSEFKERMKWLRDNKSKHRLDTKELGQLETEMLKLF